MKSDSYAVGKLAKTMRIEHIDENDTDLLKNAESSEYFAMKIRQLANSDVQRRLTCTQVVSLLIDSP